MITGKKIVITGAAGFIGSNFVRKLVDEHDVELLLIDSLTYASSFEYIKHFLNEKVSFRKTDINDFKTLLSDILSFSPDIIFHLAAESHVDNSIEDPSNFLKTNILGTFNILEVCRKLKDVLLIHISTDEVFGDLGLDEEPFTEENQYKPSSPYSASKASSDHLVRAWNRTFGTKAVISNCSNNYGPQQFPEKLIPVIIKNCLQGTPIPIYGDGKQIRDWLYVDDHCDALISISKYGQIGETYNIGTKNEIQNIELVKNICSIMDEAYSSLKPKNLSSFHDLITYVKDRPGHDARYAINNSKALKDLNWEPKVDFTHGLKKTINWYLNNSNIFSKIKGIK